MVRTIREYLTRNPLRRQIVLFMFYGFFALVAELVVRLVLDILLQGLDIMFRIPPFEEQALGSFIAFAISNILAKTISYVFNRRKTFKANNSLLYSAVLYICVCVVLLIIETIIGTPLQNMLYIIAGGHFDELDFSTEAALNPGLYQLMGTCSQLIYCTVDSIIMFMLNKFVIMKHTHVNADKEKEQEADR